MAEKVSKILKGQIITSIIYIALGACLAFMPVSTVNIICKFVFGILLILVGAYHIITYVAEKLSATILDLFAGGVLLVLGIFLFMNPQIVIKLLPILLGTFILVDSVWTLKGAIKLKKNHSPFWKFLLIGSLIFIGLGVSLVIDPFSMIKYTVMFAGWIFLCNGVVDLVYLLMLRKGLKEIVQDITAVETEGEIVGDAADVQTQDPAQNQTQNPAPETETQQSTGTDAVKDPEPMDWNARPQNTNVPENTGEEETSEN